jgi:hypothetical protein
MSNPATTAEDHDVCPVYEGGEHCLHWMDGDRCHGCGAGVEEDRIEQLGPDFFVHGPDCEGACDYGCAAGAMICGRCGREWLGTPSVHDCDARRRELGLEVCRG